MKNEQTVLFIGHRECYGLSRQYVRNTIEQAILSGYTNFLNGGQGAFDRMCAGCVHELRSQYPYIKNYLVLPYFSFHVFDSSFFDELILPESIEKYSYKAAIPARNRYLVAHASCAICYINHNWGNAAKTFSKAIKSGLMIYNLGIFSNSI